MKKQQSLLGKSNDSSYLAKRFATPVKVTSGIGLLAAGAIAVVGNGIDFSLPTLSSRFPTDGFSRKVGTKMVAKSLSNDFRFEDAVAMQETSCGNYEATVNIADGEEFGFYLYPIRNATDIATVLDDGRLHESACAVAHAEGCAAVTLVTKPNFTLSNVVCSMTAGTSAKLEIYGYEWANCNGCGCAGLGVHCVSDDSNSPWHNFVSDTTHWQSRVETPAALVGQTVNNFGYVRKVTNVGDTEHATPHVGDTEHATPCLSGSGFGLSGYQAHPYTS